MDEEEEMYRMMNEEDPWFMGEKETRCACTKTKNTSGRKKPEKKLKN